MTHTRSTSTARRLRRFFYAKPITKEGQKVFLSLEETRHLKQSLRLKEGDRCFLVGNAGVTAEAEILSFQKNDEAYLVVKKVLVHKSATQMLKLHVYFAMPHKGKTEDLIQKAQELGVCTLHPIQTKRTVMKMSSSSRARVIARWQRVLREAAKQSGASALTEVHEPVNFKKSLESVPESARIAVFHPSQKAKVFKDWIETSKGLNDLYMFIGPEGGFTLDEIETLTSLGADQVGLGEHILKVDTAFIGIIAALKLLL